MVFKKGKSKDLKFKKSGDLTDVALAKSKQVTVKKPLIKKTLIGSAEHYFTKAKVGQFIIENNSLHVGDEIIIKGPTTGEQQFVVNDLFVKGISVETAKKGDQITIAVPFRIRLSDKLYKVRVS